MPDLMFPGNPGCAGSDRGFAGTPTSCDAEPTWTVEHRYRYPRPHRTRLFACGTHAAGEPDARPLTDTDRVELARRRDRWERALRGGPWP